MPNYPYDFSKVSSEQFRTRDMIVLFKGDAYPVTVDPTMAAGGWKGCQGIQWVHSNNDEFLVTYSDGYYCGVTLYGNDELQDKYTAMSGQQSAYAFTTACAGGWLVMTSTFEQYTYLSRKSGGPLVPLVYNPSDRLVFSMRGYLTKETTEWVNSGIPKYVARGLNTFYIAFVVQPPSGLTNNYMTVQLSI